MAFKNERVKNYKRNIEMFVLVFPKDEYMENKYNADYSFES